MPDGDSSAGFFTLPLEVRSEIYAYLVSPTRTWRDYDLADIVPKGYDCSSTGKPYYDSDGSVFRVCSRMRKEAIDILLQEPIVHVKFNIKGENVSYCFDHQLSGCTLVPVLERVVTVDIGFEIFKGCEAPQPDCSTKSIVVGIEALPEMSRMLWKSTKMYFYSGDPTVDPFSVNYHPPLLPLTDGRLQQRLRSKPRHLALVVHNVEITRGISSLDPDWRCRFYTGCVSQDRGSKFLNLAGRYMKACHDYAEEQLALAGNREGLDDFMVGRALRMWFHARLYADHLYDTCLLRGSRQIGLRFGDMRLRENGGPTEPPQRFLSRCRSRWEDLSRSSPDRAEELSAQQVENDLPEENKIMNDEEHTEAIGSRTQLKADLFPTTFAMAMTRFSAAVVRTGFLGNPFVTTFVDRLSDYCTMDIITQLPGHEEKEFLIRRGLYYSAIRPLNDRVVLPSVDREACAIYMSLIDPSMEAAGLNGPFSHEQIEAILDGIRKQILYMTDNQVQVAPLACFQAADAKERLARMTFEERFETIFEGFSQWRSELLGWIAGKDAKGRKQGAQSSAQPVVPESYRVASLQIDSIS